MEFIESTNSSTENFSVVNNTVNDKEAVTYVKEVCGTAIKSTITAAKNTKTLFKTLEDGWTGVAIENFEYNFAEAVIQLEKTLAQSFATLVKEIAIVADSPIEKSNQLVERQ